jgi:hypothetical protein
MQAIVISTIGSACLRTRASIAAVARHMHLTSTTPPNHAVLAGRVRHMSLWRKLMGSSDEDKLHQQLSEVQVEQEKAKLRNEQAKVEQESAKAQQESAKAQQENINTETNRRLAFATIEQETRKAEQEAQKAEQEARKAEQEARKAEQEAQKAKQEIQKTLHNKLVAYLKALAIAVTGMVRLFLDNGDILSPFLHLFF